MSMIYFVCPSCRTSLEVPGASAGAKETCPKCGQRVRIPGDASRPQPLPNARNKTVLGEIEASPGAAALEVTRASTSPHNFFQRYHRWAGTRSIIFQSILLGWTVFMFLASSGLVLSTAMRDARTREEQDAQSAAMGFLSCCSCAGYSLIAIPLGIAAIATLESRGKS